MSVVGSDVDMITRLISSIKSVCLWDEAYPEYRSDYYDDVQTLISELSRRLRKCASLFVQLRAAARQFNKLCPDNLTLLLEQIIKPAELKGLRARGFHVGKTTRLPTPLFDGYQLLELFEKIRDEIIATPEQAPIIRPNKTPRPLSDRARYVLEALHELNAIDKDHLVTTGVVAKRAEGSGNSQQASIKRTMRGLRERKLVNTLPVGGGGVWLTKAGVRRAEHIKKQA